jgi:hypothetical protein
MAQSSRSRGVDRALAMAIEAVRTLEIPHLELEIEQPSGERVH